MPGDDSINQLINQKLGNGQYEIRSVLGRGGMATVFMARQASMNRNVAIKVMAPELAEDEQFVARFRHEAQLIAQLQHPHILPVIDFGYEGKYIYIVMQLLTGGSLDNRLGEGPLPLRLARGMLEQIASALTFGHEQGIIHRDLKPNNVMLDERNNAYLTDFGIAKMLAGTAKLTATGNILGTPAYMAPEQWRGEPVDARTDIYSLGIMVYEMVLGRLPFSGDTPYTLMYHHFNDPPPPPRQIRPETPAEIEKVILKALSKDPDDRYQSADSMAEDFSRAVRSLPTAFGVPKADLADRTALGTEPTPTDQQRPTPVTSVDEMATMMPTSAGQAAPRGATPPRIPAAGPAPSTAVSPAAAPPAKRGLNPLVIGGVALGVIAIIVVIALLALGGGGDGKKVAAVPTDTPTDEPTQTPEPTATATSEPTVTHTPEPTNTHTPEPTATSRTTTATVLAERANVRSGPGLDFEIVGSLARDEEVLVLGMSEDGDWYRVPVSSMVGTGWVSAETVRISGNPNIPVIAWPTNTPQPTATATLEPTNTPEPSVTPLPTTEPADPAVFVPSQFSRVTLGDYSLSLEYPDNWTPPRNQHDSLGYFSLSPLDALDTNQYPWVRVSRGTPAQMAERNLTRDSSSAGLAAENTVGMTPTVHRVIDDLAFPAYVANSQLPDLNNWAYVIELAPDDWVYVIAFVPRGEFDVAFGNDVLDRMVRSMEIDGVALSGPVILTTGVDPALFAPAEFTPTLLANGLTFDFPANWPAATQMGTMFYLSPAPTGGDTTPYPAIALGRGTPQELISAGLTSDSSDPTAAVLHPFGVDFTGMGEVVQLVDYAFPVYHLEVRQETPHIWIWLIAVSDTDWIYLLASAPIGDNDLAFGELVLNRLIRTLQVDGQPLVATSEALAELPLQVDQERALLDQFFDNTNDWLFANIINGELTMDTPELGWWRWSFPSAGLGEDRAFYVQVTGKITNDVNQYQYGIILRGLDYQGFKFYYWLVENTGYYALFKIEGDSTSLVFPAGQSGTIQVGPNAENTLGVLVIGDYMETYLNGELIGVAHDATYTSGTVAIFAFTFAEANVPASAAFDNFVYIPLKVSGSTTLDEQGIVTVATTGANGTQILSAALPGSEVLRTIGANELLVALARSADSQYVYGYGRGATGWFAAAGVTLAQDGTTVSIFSLPVLDASAQGIRVRAWPVTQFADSGTTATPTLAYGQTVAGTLTANASETWTFSGTAGDVIALAVQADNTSLDSQLFLTGPSGASLIGDDDSGPGLNPLIQGYALPETGVYTVEVRDLSGEGGYTLALTRN